MILLTVDELIMLHGKLLDTTGGMPGLRDCGLLESAVLGVNAGFGDVERYPSVEEKAARLAYSSFGCDRRFSLSDSSIPFSGSHFREPFGVAYFSSLRLPMTFLFSS